MAQVNRTVGVGQGRGDKNAFGHGEIVLKQVAIKIVLMSGRSMLRPHRLIYNLK
jgi:hypothetical protein